MTPAELRALLRQQTRMIDDCDVDALRLKNGQILGIVIVGKPRAGSGIKLIIEEREHGKSKKETTASREKEGGKKEDR